MSFSLKSDFFRRLPHILFHIAFRFLHRITNFTSKYGFEIQQEKTISNLFNEQLLSRNEIVPYFGYLFDLQKKTISLDLSVYEGKQFKSTISFRTAIDLK